MKKILTQALLGSIAVIAAIMLLDSVAAKSGWESVRSFLTCVPLFVIGLRLIWCADVGFYRIDKF